MYRSNGKDLKLLFCRGPSFALFFSASQYFLPTFLHTMPNIKVLIMYNHIWKHAILNGIPDIYSVTQHKSVILEKLIMPHLYKQCKLWESFEKLSIRLCEGLGNMTLFEILQICNFKSCKMFFLLGRLYPFSREICVFYKKYFAYFLHNNYSI